MNTALSLLLQAEPCPIEECGSEVLAIFIIFVGLISCTAALILSFYFSKTKSGIGRAVAFGKLAEAVNMFVIIVFTLCYYCDWFVEMPDALATVLHLSAIMVTLVSSIHLAFQTQQILDRNET